MGPHFLLKRLFGQLGNAHAVLIGRHVFGLHIHSNFRQIQIGADTGRSRNTGLFENRPNHEKRQIPSRQAVRFQIRRGVDENLINGITENIGLGDKP